MRYPYNNFPQDWNLTAGNSFGKKMDYGYHEGHDINDKGGGNSDFGKPIYAIYEGQVTSVHMHTANNTFGKHIHYMIQGKWGTVWVHHAHLSEIFVKVGDTIKEGQLIAKIGNSGTTWAHDHWAIKLQPLGIDAIAKTKEDLQKWTNPLNFVSRWMSEIITPPTNPTMPTEPTILTKDALKDAIRALTGKEPSNDTINWRLDQMKNGWNFNQVIMDILQNDGDFKAKWTQNNSLANYSTKQLLEEAIKRV